MNIILFGPPGAGKGTQAEYIVNHFGLAHLSTGNMFRSAIQNKTSLGIKVKYILDAGELVSDDVVVDLVQEETTKDMYLTGCAFDGFPRTISQAEALDGFLSKKQMSIAATLALDVDEDILVSRLLSRGKDSGRADDQDEEKIRNRFAEYNAKTAPLIAYYTAQEKFYAIDGSRSIEAITDHLTRIVDQL